MKTVFMSGPYALFLLFNLIANVLFAVVTIGSLLMLPFYGQSAVIALIITAVTYTSLQIVLNGFDSMRIIMAALHVPPTKENKNDNN